METARGTKLPDVSPNAKRFAEQTRRYRESVELYHQAMRDALEVRARVRQMRRAVASAAPVRPPPPAPRKVLIGRPVVNYRTPDQQLVDDPTLPLSERELQVARLVAKGSSNDEIARALVITSGTAANHVARIMKKLGVRSRTSIGVWAVERGFATG